MNYIGKFKDSSEVKDKNFYNDLEIKLLIDIDEAKLTIKKHLGYKISTVMQTGSTTTHTNTEVQPALLTHFEPWFPLLGLMEVLEQLALEDLRRVNLNFYGLQVTRSRT
jgi:hypothetical protein